jgi:nitroreductase
MKRRLFHSLMRTLAVAALFAAPLAAFAQNLQPITLPKPQMMGGMRLMDALSARKTTREFGADKLPLQTLSNLLWAAFGVNRTEMAGRTPKPGRTAPSAMNLQEIDLYVAFPEGVYIYEAVPHRLIPVAAKDIRVLTNRNAAAGTAALCFIFVENLDKRPAPQAKTPTAGAPPAAAPPAAAPRATSGEVDAGFIGQNVYLFCASEGLNAWFYGTDREGLAKALNLRPGQRVLYGQAVGYPKKK